MDRARRAAEGIDKFYVREDDGYADMTEEHMEALKKRKVSILTVISRPSQPKRLLRRSRLGDGELSRAATGTRSAKHSRRSGRS